MLKEYVSVSIGVSTLLIAAIAAYGVTSVNTEIQSNKLEPTKMPDYSDELDSLKLQISSIKSDLVILNTLKTDIIRIQEKLTNLEKKNTQVEKIVSFPDKLTVDLDKSTYLPGETIKITAFGPDPQKIVQIQFLDDNGFILTNKETWSDSTGKIMYGLKLSNALPPGNYEVRLILDELTESQQIKIKAPGTSENPTNQISTDSYPLTVKTDKSIYQKGEIIEVSGTGKPNTAVTGTLTSPTGKTYTSTTSTERDGTYIMFYATSQPYEKGKWYITTSNVAKTIVVSISIE